MKNAVALIAVAGIASVAAAQNFSLSMTPSVSQTVEGGNFTVTVYGDADMGSHILGGAFGLSSDSALIDSMTWSPAAWSAFNTDGGYAGNGNYNEVIFGQLVIPGIFPPAELFSPMQEVELDQHGYTCDLCTGFLDQLATRPHRTAGREQIVN